MSKKHILLSIRPKYINEIKAGIKKFEFRKQFPNILENNINKKVIIYCSTPKMEIIGSFVIQNHYKDDFYSLMQTIKADKEYTNRISNYFTNKSLCHALQISDFKLYDSTLSLQYLRDKYKGFVPGQNYRYLDDKIINDIIKRNGST